MIDFARIRAVFVVYTIRSVTHTFSRVFIPFRRVGSTHVFASKATALEKARTLSLSLREVNKTSTSKRKEWNRRKKEKKSKRARTTDLSMISR